MENKKRIGQKHLSSSSTEIEIIEYYSSSNCTIRFTATGVIRKNICYNNITKGNVKDNYSPSVCDIGFIGEGLFKSTVNSVTTPHYASWHNMICRCYDKNQVINNPTYKDCTVDKIWHNFQNFAEWFEQNYKPHMEGWHLDKDILVKGNKVYSPETCCFLPDEINKLFHRSNYIKAISFKGTKFIVSSNIKNQKQYLGLFDTQDEAFRVYENHRKKYLEKIALKYKNVLHKSVYERLINSSLNKENFTKYTDDLIVESFNKGVLSNNSLKIGAIDKAFLLGMFKSYFSDNDYTNENILKFIKNN